MIRKIFMLSFLFIACIFLFACNDKEIVDGGENDLKDVLKDLADVTLEEGETYTVNVSESLMLMSSDKLVVAVDDATKTITAVSEGEATVTVYLASDTSVSKEIKVTVTAKEDNPGEDNPGEDNPGGSDDVQITGVEITSTVEIIYLDDEVQLTAKVLPETANQEVTWKSLSRTKATIDENGVITVLRSGEAKFVATSVADNTVKAEVSIEVKAIINPDKFFENLGFENPVVQNFTAYGFEANWNGTLLGTVTKYLFEDLRLTQNIMPVGHADRPGTAMKALYVTVHDVGATSGWTNGEGTSNYCHSVTESSWHFSVGNDGAWQQIPMNEIGWHAGDGTSVPLEFTDTGIKATSDEPAVVTLSSDGYFEMNGEKTTIKAPTKSNGSLCRTSDLPSTGINNYVNATTGTYWIGNTWWSNTYQTLSNRGGNLNSIGIETSVAQRSNVFYTWNITAKLIGEVILPQNGLLPRDVKQHNTFSGKDCPMTMRHAGMWSTFMELVEAEYYMNRYFSTWDIELICDSPYVNEKGQITGLPDTDTTVTYQLKVNDKLGYEKTFDFSFTLPAKSGYNL